MSTSNPVLQIDKVTKRFGKKVAVDSLSLSIPQGKLYVFLGPNGAGKTTTMKMTVGLLKPDSGTILIQGSPVESFLGKGKPIPFTYVPEEPHLYERLTAMEFFHFIGRTSGIPQDIVQERVEQYGGRLGVLDFINDAAVTYSHGMRQRVAVTAALLPAPALMIIDEPMVGLDPAATLALKQIMREVISAGTSILLSTHTLSVAQEIADRIGVMNFGKIVAEGRPEELALPGETLENMFLRITNPV